MRFTVDRLSAIASGRAPTNTYTVHELVAELLATMRARDAAYAAVERVYALTDDHADSCAAYGCVCTEDDGGRCVCDCPTAAVVEALESVEASTTTRHLARLSAAVEHLLESTVGKRLGQYHRERLVASLEDKRS